MSQRFQLTRQMMRAATRFHADETQRQRAHVPHQLGTANFFFHWIAPDASIATKWNEVLPISMPITAASVMTVLLNEGGQDDPNRVAP